MTRPPHRPGQGGRRRGGQAEPCGCMSLRLYGASRRVSPVAPLSRVGRPGEFTGIPKCFRPEEVSTAVVAAVLDCHLVAGSPCPADGSHSLVAVEDAVIQRCFGNLGPGVTEDRSAAGSPSQFRLTAPRAATEGVAGVVNRRGSTSPGTPAVVDVDRCVPRAYACYHILAIYF